MKILDIKDVKSIKTTTILPKDINGREIKLYYLKNVIITGESVYYPNVLLLDIDKDILINPINETTMSLKYINKNKEFTPETKTYKNTVYNSVFFFNYNFDNYYHFIYDSLPYLISFLEIRKTNKDVKLLMQYPFGKNSFYRFVTEFLELLGITNEDIIMTNTETLYTDVLVSTSYTHGHDSNLPPREEIYQFYQNLVKKVKSKSIETPKKIYISRRSWLHGDTSNIGTNYTTRRKLINEDELVGYLNEIGYTEIFTENLTTIEKILIFSKAESVIGAIGGGICNVLFSKPECRLIALISPHFLNVNKRFTYSLNRVDVCYFEDTENIEKTEFKKYMRVKCSDLVGEIINVNKDFIDIAYIETNLSGWNNENDYKTITKKTSECIKLDEGLNSAWKINLKKLKNIL